MARKTVTFDEEFPRLSRHVAETQAALRDALDGIASGDSGARACGRALGLTRSLGWSFWNLAFAPDVPAALRAMPGDRGWKLLVDGLARRGCAPSRMAALDRALRALQAELRSRSLSPTLLRSIASGALDTQVELRRMRTWRRRAREAAEWLYGVRSSMVCAAMAAGPPDSTGIVDTVGITIFEGLARMRPGPQWPIFQGQLNYGNAESETSALVPSRIGWGIDHLCSPGAVGTSLRRSGSTDHLVSFVDTGTQGDKGIRAAFAQRALRCGRIGPAPDGETGRDPPHLGMILTVPTKVAVFDLLLHERIPVRADPSGALYGPPDPWPSPTAEHGMPERLEAKRLPLDAVVESLRGTEAPAGAAALRGPWTELTGMAADGLGQPLSAFRRYRLTITDPPMHGRILMRWWP